MRRVFVDSSGFFALVCIQDRCHEQARDLFAQANRDRWRLLTTNAVVYETHALMLTRLRDGRRQALEFLDRLGRTKARVERIRITDEQRAIALLRARADKDYSLCDALSFIIMDRLRIAEAIAFDRHFHQYGRFKVL